MSLEFLHFVGSTVAVSALITYILQAVEIRSINNIDRFHTCNHIIHDAAPPAVLQCAHAALALRNDVVADVHPIDAWKVGNRNSGTAPSSVQRRTPEPPNCSKTPPEKRSASTHLGPPNLAEMLHLLRSKPELGFYSDDVSLDISAAAGVIS